jgi:hypothetical protein
MKRQLADIREVTVLFRTVAQYTLRPFLEIPPLILSPVALVLQEVQKIGSFNHQLRVSLPVRIILQVN